MFFALAFITQNFIYGIIPLYLPILLRELGYRTAVVGILLAIAEGAGILGPFLFGRLADRSGNYKGIIVFLYFLPVAVALPIASITHPAISAVLIILLFAGYRSAIPLVEAMTTISIGEKGNYGKLRACGSIAYVCFVFFIQWIPVIRPNTPGNIAFWICLTCILAMIVTLITPSRYANRKNQKTDPKTEAGTNGLFEAPQQKPIWTPVFIIGISIIALSRLAMTPANSFFPLFLVEYMKWDAVGLMFGIAAISEIPFMFFSHRLIRRFGAMPILAFSCIIVALRLGLYAIFPFKAGIIAAQLLHSFCYGLFHPAAVAFISYCVPPEKRSFGMTVYMSVGWGLPALLGNFMCGFIVEYAGYRHLFGFFTIFAILGAAIYFIFNLRLKEINDHGKAEKT